VPHRRTARLAHVTTLDEQAVRVVRGVAYGGRTRNLRIHNPMLCRLS
jgi:hypothetical protein